MTSDPYAEPEFFALERREEEARNAAWEIEQTAVKELPTTPPCHPSRQATLTGAHQEPETAAPVLVEGWPMRAGKTC